MFLFIQALVDIILGSYSTDIFNEQLTSKEIILVTQLKDESGEQKLSSIALVNGDLLDIQRIQHTTESSEPILDLAQRINSIQSLELSLDINVYYVAPYGNDRNGGTVDSPFATIEKAHELVNPGDFIFLRGGIYELAVDSTILLSKNGSEGAEFHLFAYPGERPILDASHWTRYENPWDSKAVIIQRGDYWHVRGIEITGGPKFAYHVRSASNNIWEQLNIHGNEGTGFIITGEGNNNNLVLDCDFHHNFDPINDGTNADGFGMKHGSGIGNVIRTSRFYNNSDDGLDLWEFTDGILIEGSWAFGNGVDRWDVGYSFGGNGSGFKLGRVSSHIPMANHMLLNNLAWSNSQGFDFNDNNSSMQIYNNTSFANTTNGFRFSNGNHILRNNLSIGDKVIVRGAADDSFNSWTLIPDVHEGHFISLDPQLAEGPRSEDGSLPSSNFLHISPHSDLIDAGISVGLPYSELSPDLGAFEFENDISH